MSLNYLVYHNIFATVVGAIVTLGLENYLLDINTVVTRYMKYQDQNLDLMFCTLLQVFSCKQGYLVIYIALMLPILPEAACLDSTGIGESE